MTEWYARPVLFVADVPVSVSFYRDKLGFTPAWSHEAEGKTIVAQVDRGGCELILSSQWPGKVGAGMMFISLDRPVFDALWSELTAKGVTAKDGWWGYPSKIIDDPDGNQLYFPDPGKTETAA
jgi:catechol 2,3-dioxygenase-like lactoylglutathione lyase family enzyme